jgi:ABC-type transporter MlaC component
MTGTLRAIAFSLTLATAATAGLAPAAWAGATCADAKVADGAGNAFLKAAKTGSADQFAAALDSSADMDKIASFALGRYRKQVPANRMEELVDLTSRYVSTTLADFAKKFRGLRIIPIDCRGDGTVKSRLEFGGGRSAQTVLWRFKGSKIIDVNVQDAWLAQLLRSNFQSIIQKNGGSIDALFDRLQRS